MNRFSLHRLEDGACIHTYNTNPVKTFPKQVVFEEQATLVVGGSDTGTIHIFDKNEGTLKQVLQHADKGLIFGATSTNDTEPTISIGCHKRTTSLSDRSLGSAIKNFIQGIVQLAIAMAIIAYVSNIYSKLGAQMNDLTNTDIRSLVEQYIEAQRGEELEREARKQMADMDKPSL
ncbi:uncharacterized protein F5147DRAFT_657766 [Suillus discolor]|uniref:Uncharacterized protein n=1 Tax=Suillus discolor TaxID=1912936 RepID=A0A9P7JNC0_9AGAM|nr:uncharacterized protein F5147DRAFT_657766 [Suillus discolor]KAG2092149.1 hypothetical protein F5147DRAFT_657766 [Suillus discolor]